MVVQGVLAGTLTRPQSTVDTPVVVAPTKHGHGVAITGGVIGAVVGGVLGLGFAMASTHGDGANGLIWGCGFIGAALGAAVLAAVGNGIDKHHDKNQ